MVAYSGSKFCYGIFVHFQPILFLWEKVKKKGSREIYCLFYDENLDEHRLKNILPKKVLTIQVLCDIL